MAKPTNREEASTVQLHLIQICFVTGALYSHYRDEVKSVLALKKSKTIEKKVKIIFKWVALALTSRDNIVIGEPETAITRRESQVNILQAALQDLEEIRAEFQGRAPTRAYDRAGEEVALDQDARIFNKLLKVIPKKDIVVYDMDTQVPERIAVNAVAVPTCEAVIVALKNQLKISGEVDLWARRHGRHRRTRDQFSWTHIPPKTTEFITAMDLEFVKDLSPGTEYIVALMVEDNRDVPKKIVLPSKHNGGRGPCTCPTVADKLDPKSAKMTAMRIKYQEDLLAQNLCLLSHRTNDLLVKA